MHVSKRNCLNPRRPTAILGAAATPRYKSPRTKLLIALPALLIVLAGCPPVAIVPSLLGMTQSSASAALDAAGLTVGLVTGEYSSLFDAGCVILQDPPAGSEIPEGSEVTIIVSTGPRPVVAPDLEGMTRGAAVSALMSAGLVVGPSTRAFSAVHAAGLVMGQNPAAGVETLPGTPVALVMSKGPEVVAVPRLTGMTEEEAVAALLLAGLSVGPVTETYSADVAVGRVAAQTPEAATNVAPGTSVALALSKGMEPGTVPYLTGMTIPQAMSALAFSSLTTGDVVEAWSETVPLGRVITHQPAPGVEVASGSRVDLVVSKGPGPRPVPDVVGMTEAEAQSALEAAGLVLGEITLVHDLTPPEGTVIAQTPLAGTIVDEASPVHLTVATDAIVIDTIEQLQAIGNDPDYPLDGKYILGSDIDASKTSEWNEGEGFIPIGEDPNAPDKAFTGSLDGRGHAISGLVFRGWSGYLFYDIDPGGSVHDVHLTSFSADCRGEAAGIALTNNGQISDCSLEGTCRGKEGFGSGVACLNFPGGVISRCRFIGNVGNRPYFFSGGIVASNRGIVEDCEFSGLAVGGEWVGGIAGENAGSIKNCVARGKIQGERDLGGIVGCNGSTIFECPECGVGTLINCRSECEVSSRIGPAGGITGSNSGYIGGCSATGTVWAFGYSHFGGFAGINSGTVESSYSRVTVWGTGNAVGGFIGANTGQVQDCFATGRVKAASMCGGLIGENIGTVARCYSTGRVESEDDPVGGLIAAGTGTAEGCFWTVETSGQTASAGGTAITVEQLLDSSTFKAAAWDYTGSEDDPPIWAQIDAQTVPYLKWTEAPGVMYQLEISAENGVVISTPPAGAYAPWTFVAATHEAPGGEFTFAGWSDGTFFDGNPLETDAFYLVMHDDSTVIGVFLPPVIAIDTIEELQRIGEDPRYPLKWSYVLTQDLDASETQHWKDGAGFDPIGAELFPFSGSFDGQSHIIRNLFINRPNDPYAGLFAVTDVGSSVANIGLEGGSVTGWYAVGMLAGWNIGTITDCHASGSVYGDDAGGLIGSNGGRPVGPWPYHVSGLIQRCSASCLVSSGGPYSEDQGGLVGFNIGQIDQCFATGAVSGFQSVGGFVGHLQWGQITDCYATGAVEGMVDVGGFIGEARNGYALRCYSSGPLSCPHANIDGFIGYADSEFHDINCYWDKQTSGVPDPWSAYGGRTTAEMMSAATFETWDFDAVWGIDEGISYPYLRWQR